MTDRAELNEDTLRLAFARLKAEGVRKVGFKDRELLPFGEFERRRRNGEDMGRYATIRPAPVAAG